MPQRSGLSSKGGAGQLGGGDAIDAQLQLGAPERSEMPGGQVDDSLIKYDKWEVHWRVACRSSLTGGCAAGAAVGERHPAAHTPRDWQFVARDGSNLYRVS